MLIVKLTVISDTDKGEQFRQMSYGEVKSTKVTLNELTPTYKIIKFLSPDSWVILKSSEIDIPQIVKFFGQCFSRLYKCLVTPLGHLLLIVTKDSEFI